MGMNVSEKKQGVAPLLSARNLTKAFQIGRDRNGKLVVLRGVSLAVSEGEIIAIVGASGAGKSTLLHILGTLDRPSSGEVFFEGRNLFAMGDDQLAHLRNNRIGFVFQFHHLLPEFTALENVAMPALIQGKAFPEVKERALFLLGEVGLAERADQKPPKMSGGEAQRVAVARAFMNDPAIVLADEPTGNLDSTNAELLHDLVWEFNRKVGQTFIIVTHNELLARKADRVLRIADGILQEQESGREEGKRT
jgi:lipoprotein-releasing system ATP-binding protein